MLSLPSPMQSRIISPALAQTFESHSSRIGTRWPVQHSSTTQLGLISLRQRGGHRRQSLSQDLATTSAIHGPCALPAKGLLFHRLVTTLSYDDEQVSILHSHVQGTVASLACYAGTCITHFKARKSTPELLIVFVINSNSPSRTR